MKPSFGIVLPNNDPNRIGAIQLQVACAPFVSARLVSLDALFQDIVIPDNIPSLLHFLSNDQRISLVAAVCLKTGLKVLNEDFLLGGYDKALVQSKLEKAGLPVPRRFDSSTATSGTLIRKPHLHNRPLQIIAESDGMIVDTKGFYLEQYIDADLEQKVYIVDGEAFFHEDGVDRRLIQEHTTGVRDALHMEVCSIDLLRERYSRQWYIIDVNPASTYFYSPEARIKFAHFVKEKML